MDKLSIKYPYNRCTLYIILWLAYYLQGTLYESGSLMSQGILAAILLISVINVFRVLSKKNNPIYFKGLNLLILMFTVYGLILIISGSRLYITESDTSRVRNFGYLKEIYMSLLPIYSFYYYSNKKLLSKKSLMIWTAIFFVVAVAQFYRSQRETLEVLMANNSRFDQGTNNGGYLFLSLIPSMVLFMKKPILQYVGLGLCVLFIMMAMKRGAILIAFIVGVIFIVQNLQNVSRKKKTFSLFLTFAIFVFGFFLVQYLLDNNDYFNSRLEDTLSGNSGHRAEMYSNLWNVFLYKSSIFEILFGRGAWGTLTVNMNFAHNDWLEILINQGLLGICVFIYYWICLFLTYRNAKSPFSKQIIAYIAIICFLKTLFSMSYSDMQIYATCIFGYALSNTKLIKYESSDSRRFLSTSSC